MNIKKDHINFSVGPVMMDGEIRALSAEPIPYFRTPDFSALMHENERLILEFLHAPENSRAVFLTGSGTASMDASVSNLFGKNDKLLIVNGGSFGHRFCEICETYKIPFDDIKLPSGKALRAEHLEKYKNGGYTGFLVNMDETSTGVLYDMELIGGFCRENGLLLVVDAISSFISDELDMEKIGADIVIIGSQKALACPPGVSVVAISPRALGIIEKNTPPCYYLNLKSALSNGERGQTPFTPAVGTLILLNARLTAIKKNTLSAEREKISRIARDFRGRIKKYPFRVVSESLSNTVTPLSPTGGISAYSVFEILKDEYNIIVCPNGGETRDTVFRVGHIGALEISDNDALFAALDDLVARKILC